MRNRHGFDEVFLEIWLNRRFHFFDGFDDLFDFIACRLVKERNSRSGAGGVASGRDLGQVAVGNQAEDHRVFNVDMTAEGAG